MKKAYINGKILTGKEDCVTPITGYAIIVEDKKITEIREYGNDEGKLSKELCDCEIVDLKGSYIMPGLINMHVHLAGSGKPKKKQSDPAKAVKLITANKLMKSIGHKMVAGYAKTQLLSGTTTIRTVGGIQDFDTVIRDDIKAGRRIGPRILASNMAISVPGGHMAGSLGYEATSPEEAAHYVDVIAKEKPDLIKLMVTGGVMDAEVVGEPGVLRMPAELVKAASDRAHELGFMVAAHVESPIGVLTALMNGVDSIEHGAKPGEDTIEWFKKTNAFQVSTLSPAIPYALFDPSIAHTTYEQHENGKVVLEGIQKMARENIKNGVPVGLGTDTACPYVTQYDMWREMEYYVRFCDVSRPFALYSATLLNAKLAHIDDITGSIEVGKSADMIVCKNNPYDGFEALRELEMVIFEGNCIKNPKVKKIPEVEKALDEFMKL